MILTTDELKREINKLEDGKFIFITTDDWNSEDFIIEKICKKSSHFDDSSIWNYVLCMKKSESMGIRRYV